MENITNIIPFPKVNVNRQIPSTDAEIALNVNLIKFNHINETLETIIPMLFTNIELAGFGLDEEDDNIRDGALIVESLRSLLCKIHNIEHPFHILNEKLFVDLPDGGLKITDVLNVEFKETSLD